MAHKKEIDGNALAKYNLDATVKENFEKYQTVLCEYPQYRYENKLVYDQYLKSINLHSKDKDKQDAQGVDFEQE